MSRSSNSGRPREGSKLAEAQRLWRRGDSRYPVTRNFHAVPKAIWGSARHMPQWEHRFGFYIYTQWPDGGTKSPWWFELWRVCACKKYSSGQLSNMRWPFESGENTTRRCNRENYGRVTYIQASCLLSCCCARFSYCVSTLCSPIIYFYELLLLSGNQSKF